MGKKDEKRAALQRLRLARAELERISRESRDETPEYLAANRRVIEAEKAVPWWRR
jgi:hypothetical protein